MTISYSPCAPTPPTTISPSAALPLTTVAANLGELELLYPHPQNRYVGRMTDVVVLGPVAGLWAALGAARRLDELATHREVNVTVISAQPYHDIRVRNYEADLTPCRIPLKDVLDPAGVGHITAAGVTAIDPASHIVQTLGGHWPP